MERNQPIQLSLEQEFNLRAFEEQIQPINLDQAKTLLVQLYGNLLIREAHYKHFFKEYLLTCSCPFDLK